MKNNTIFLIILIGLFILVLLGTAYYFIMHNTELKKQFCGTHQESYTTDTSGCDNMNNCRCLHKSFFGLGSCDSCQCFREVSNC
jgi:hypothetical protein